MVTLVPLPPAGIRINQLAYSCFFGLSTSKFNRRNKFVRGWVLGFGNHFVLPDDARIVSQMRSSRMGSSLRVLILKKKQ